MRRWLALCLALACAALFGAAMEVSATATTMKPPAPTDAATTDPKKAPLDVDTASVAPKDEIVRKAGVPQATPDKKK